MGSFQKHPENHSTCLAELAFPAISMSVYLILIISNVSSVVSCNIFILQSM